jgi:hypothetical protein
MPFEGASDAPTAMLGATKRKSAAGEAFRAGDRRLTVHHLRARRRALSTFGPALLSRIHRWAMSL